MSSNWFNTILILVAIVGLTISTEVEQCPGAPVISNDDVSITDCETPPCIFKRRRTTGIELKLTPSETIEELKSKVQAVVRGNTLKFPGYDGDDACAYIYDEVGEKKLGCPLKAGEKYLYKRDIMILPNYPLMVLKVHFGLVDPKTDYVACFEVDAKITR